MTGLRIAQIAGLMGAVLMLGAAGAADLGWLSICSKCVSPTISRASGLGTANAVAEGKITAADVADWCAQWEPDDRTCARQNASEIDGKLYRATADCTQGKITTIQGESYVYAGLWDNSDIGGGRSKWRDRSGQIVGRDNASNGLGISQQWEVLCPKGLVRATATAPGSAGPGNRPPPGAIYAVGQNVEAKYMSSWIPARVTAIRPGASGPDYAVVLANGQRGVVPARMLRPAGR